MSPRAVAWSAGLAGAASGLLGISLICSIDLSTHVLVYHVLPVPLLALAAASALARVLRW
jgi:hypothetical protein